jgi:hypothetical protein
MYRNLASIFLFFVFAAFHFVCAEEAPSILNHSPSSGISSSPFFYSSAGQERVVQFNAEYVSSYTDLETVKKLSSYDREDFVNYTLPALARYQFGPLTNRNWGSVGETISLTVDWDKAFLRQGFVVLPYSYRGVWILKKEMSSFANIRLPVPYNLQIIFTPNWKACTDSDPEHQTQSFFWYFWDPSRNGCEHQLGKHYQKVDIRLDANTTQTTASFPEFSRMINDVDRKNELNITMAFGYFEDAHKPDPETDKDDGVAQYRLFVSKVSQMIPTATVSDIRLSDYIPGTNRDIVLGKKFTFEKSGVLVNLKIVVNADIDQMKLFAKSFAHDHDSYFGWLGHSRVGSGFDASTFKSMVANNPSYYSISSNYQLIYWGGCNSYSYYTRPFFKMKADAFPQLDPHGTKNLDIIANGLPSYFTLNSQNAMVQLQALLNWERPISYQSWIDQMEGVARKFGATVLSVVLGDEDNNM